MSENVHKGHRARMRESSLQYGLRNLSDHEILEMILYYAVPRVDTNPISHALLEHFGSFKGVLEADVLELQEIAGVGDSAAHLLRLFSEGVRRYLTEEHTQSYRYDEIGKIAEYLYPKFVGTNREHLYMLRFNNRLNLLGCDLISEGDNQLLRCYDAQDD